MDKLSVGATGLPASAKLVLSVQVSSRKQRTCAKKEGENEEIFNRSRVFSNGCFDRRMRRRGYRLQAIGVTISPFILNMLPYTDHYCLIVVTITTAHKHIGEPESLGKAYDREER